MTPGSDAAHGGTDETAGTSEVAHPFAADGDSARHSAGHSAGDSAGDSAGHSAGDSGSPRPVDRVFVKPDKALNGLSDAGIRAWAEALHAALMEQMDPDGSRRAAARASGRAVEADDASLDKDSPDKRQPPAASKNRREPDATDEH